MITSADFNIADFPSGTHTWTHLQFGEPMRVPVTVPLAVARGVSCGPTVLGVSLVHGDEFEGPSAVAEFFNQLDVQSLSGTFLGLPLTNPWAYASQSRNTPDHFDGLNLARQFPGDPSGSRTQQHAALLYDWVRRILTPNDVFVDFHSAGTRYEYLSMVGFHPTGDATESTSWELATVFGFENIWLIPDSPTSNHTFNGSIARSGIPTIGTEVRGLGCLRETDVQSLTAGLHKILAHKRMLPDPPTSKLRTAHTTQPVLFSTSGILRTQVDLDDQVYAGQTLAQVLSIKGDLLETITSPATGQVWATRRFASVHPNDLAFLIAKTEQKNC